MDGPGGIGMGMGMGYDRMAGYERLGYPGTGNTPSPTLPFVVPHCCVDPSSLLLGKTIAAYRI